MVIPSDYKKFKHHFCGDTCRQLWYSSVFSQDEVWRDISRKRATNILSSGLIDTNTKPQILINNLLDSMNVKYRNEENFVYYSVDNYLYEFNLIIEVMGDFWHSNPNKFPYNSLRNVQVKRIPKDKAKHTYILKHHGIEILYLWESDIYKNIDICENLIREYINKKGELNNYNSFNYRFENGKLLLKDTIILPYHDLKNSITNA